MIPSGSPHVRPMGRTCGEPDEIELTAVGVELNGSRCRHTVATNPGRPFFAQVSPKAAHEPFQPAPWYTDAWNPTWPKGTRREPFNFTPIGVTSISFAPPHPHTCAPCGPSARVVPGHLTKSRKTPTRNLLPPFFVAQRRAAATELQLQRGDPGRQGGARRGDGDADAAAGARKTTVLSSLDKLSVGVRFFDFVRRSGTTRTTHPPWGVHASYVQTSNPT